MKPNILWQIGPAVCYSLPVNPQIPLIVQRYFDAWNQHDSAALVATFADGGTYADPASQGPLSDTAIGVYAEALWTAFPDLSFDLVSAAQDGDGMVSAEWLMRGTNHGSINGLPPTGAAVALPGADFIRIEGEKIRSVQGYFDSAALPRALGLDVIVQPRAIGPFSFGTSTRAATGTTAIPGAFSITWIEARSEEEKQKIMESGRKIATEMLAMPGFISWVGTIIGNRMTTITAWETPEATAQLMRGGEHREAVGRFFSNELGTNALTGVWVPGRINPRRQRCPECSRFLDAEKAQGKCGCGAALPEFPAYW
ncbi:MAG TPA: ester cyclase [Terracidiphilus sp.]|nr:ester cyclase [Terracidiphilus sp.]